MKIQGRPSIFNINIANEICTRLAMGESMRSICNCKNMPNRATVHQWVINDIEGFSSQYARAREVGLDEMADEILDISDDGRNDWMERNDKANKGYAFNGENSQRSRLRVDSRKWYLSKIAPKRYGDRTSLVVTEAKALNEMSDADINAELEMLLASGVFATDKRS